MLDHAGIIEAISLDLLKRGYAILEECTVDYHSVDIVADSPESGAKMFINVFGLPQAKTAEKVIEGSETESQVFYSVSRAIVGSMSMKGACKFNPGDQLVMAFPGTARFREYLSGQKPVLDTFGIDVILVTEEKTIEKL